VGFSEESTLVDTPLSFFLPAASERVTKLLVSVFCHNKLALQMDARTTLEERIGKGLETSFINSVREKLESVPTTVYWRELEYKKHTDKQPLYEGLELRSDTRDVIVKWLEVSHYMSCLRLRELIPLEPQQHCQSHEILRPPPTTALRPPRSYDSLWLYENQASHIALPDPRGPS
jgi:hypothetical protein